jgi:hypothetical protein
MFRSASLVLALFALGCPPASGDDDDNSDDSLGGLDRDGDGVLTADDVDEGEGAVYAAFNLNDENGDADPTEDGATTADVSLSPASMAWYLQATLTLGGEEVTFSLRFENAGGEAPEVGRGIVTNANASSASHYAYANESDAEVEITSSDSDSASGFLDGDVSMEVIGEMEQPTGETIVLRGFAFNDVPFLEPM